MIRAVVFDLDDTLYPERMYALSGFRTVAAGFASVLGDPAKAMTEMVRLMEEGHRGRIFNELLAGRSMRADEELVGEMVTAYRTHRPRLAFHPDAAAALRRLEPRYRLGLITDGSKEMQWAKIDALGLRDMVEEIIVTNELAGPAGAAPDRPPTNYGKPHPFAFELIAQRFSLPHAECAYVADNPSKDFVAPNALGWLTVQVRRKDGIYLDAVVAERGSADHQIDSLDDLDALLEARRSSK